jgi:hypothetical protein
MPVSRTRVFVGLSVAVACVSLGGCAGQGTAGWSGQVSAEGGASSLSAGDPFGQALYSAHQHRIDREQRLVEVLGEDVAMRTYESENAVATIPGD